MGHLTIKQTNVSVIPNGTTSSVPTTTLSTAPVNGNLLYAILNTYPTTMTAATGWTQDVAYDNGGSHCAAFYKYAGASESTTQSPITNTEQIWEMVMFEVAGVSGTWATDHIATSGSVTSGSLVSGGTNSYSTTNNNELMLTGIVGGPSNTTTGTGSFSQSTTLAQTSVVGGNFNYASSALAGSLFTSTSGTAISDTWSWSTSGYFSGVSLRLQSAAASTAYGQMLLCNI